MSKRTFSKGRFDKVAQESGKWFDYDGAKFLLSSAKSTAFQKAWAESTTDGEIEDEDKLVKALAEVVNDWENVADEDGVTPLEFNREDLEFILKDDEEFSKWVMATILNQDNYKRQAVVKKAKK